MRATGMPSWMVMMTASQASFSVGKPQMPPAMTDGNALQAQRDLGDDAKRALRTDEEPRQVVTGRGFARPAAGAG
jgi:hypothetical protein